MHPLWVCFAFSTSLHSYWLANKSVSTSINHVDCYHKFLTLQFFYCTFRVPQLPADLSLYYMAAQFLSHIPKCQSD